jgi:hypothetical protein
MQSSVRILKESLHPEEIVAGSVCALLLAAGALVVWLDPTNRWMTALVTLPTKQVVLHEARLKDIVLPHSVIAGVTLIGLVLASVLACFLYYPPVSEIRQEMNAIEAEMVGAYNQGDWEKLEYWIPIQEDWSNKLVVSAYLRGRPLDRFTKLKLQVYMKKLELLEHAAEVQELEEARKYGRAGATAFQRLKKATE